MKQLISWLKTLHPLYDRRMQRLELVRSITLPYGNLDHARVGPIMPDIHPTIDHYLTFDERIDLLIRYNWMRPLPGTDRYYRVNYLIQMKVIGDHINQSEWKHQLKDELKVYNCGLDY